MPRDERHIENIPYGSLGIIPLKSCAALGEKVNNYLVEWRNRRSDSTNLNGYKKDSYIVPVETPRFGSGEAKADSSQLSAKYELSPPLPYIVLSFVPPHNFSNKNGVNLYI